MADRDDARNPPIPVGRIGVRRRERAEPGPDPGIDLGRAIAGVLRHLGAVLDREDRLESGTGTWLEDFTADAAAAEEAVRDGTLRTLRMAAEPLNFAILEALSPVSGTPAQLLAEATGLGRLPLAERVADLVSAGLAVKLPEANQVAGTAAGAAIVDIVHRAVDAGVRDLGADR